MEHVIRKVSSETAAKGEGGDRLLASGQDMSMRLWLDEAPQEKPATSSPYETLGYVLKGKAELRMGDLAVQLRPGDSWIVPAGAPHSYRIIETFSAVEATSPRTHDE